MSLLAGLSLDGEFGFARRKISNTPSRRWGCDRGSGVPSTLSLSSSTIKYCAGFVLVWVLIAHQPGDWETAWRTDALLTGAVRLQGTLARTKAGDAATAAQLISIESSYMPLVWGIVAAVTPWAFRAARFWQSPFPPCPRPSVDFFATLEVVLASEALAGLQIRDVGRLHHARRRLFLPP